VNEVAIERNLTAYGRFSALERVLMALGRAGANRQEMHEILREHSQTAWAALAQGLPNPLIELLCRDERLAAWLPVEKIQAMMDASAYVGDAPHRARDLVRQIRSVLEG
jgi:adenylosuccinate lyase